MGNFRYEISMPFQEWSMSFQEWINSHSMFKRIKKMKSPFIFTKNEMNVNYNSVYIS